MRTSPHRISLKEKTDVRAILISRSGRLTLRAMAATLDYPHIVKFGDEPARLERHPRTRVSMIVTDYVGGGWSAEEIVLQYPYLTLAEIHAALGYYHDHRQEIDQELAIEERDAREGWRTQVETPVLTRLRGLTRAEG